MNIQAVVTHLNNLLGLQLSASYYSYIQVWQDWWRGYHKPFHQRKELDAENNVRHRDLFTLRIAKKICEDWAALLLNEKTRIALAHPASSDFLQGKNMTGGVFGDCQFWYHANRLIEKAFYSGTGAIILRIDNMTRNNNAVQRTADTSVHLEYLPAENIIPLTVKQGRITEAAFCSEILSKGKKIVQLEIHTLQDGGYNIQNQFFEETNGFLSSTPLPENMLDGFNTHSDIPLFAIIRPNVANCIDEGCGLGMSIFAQALDNLKGVDLAFNNFCRDFQLGGKKVFINRSLIASGKGGVKLAPDDIAQSLFLTLGDKAPDDEQLIYEHNPELRVQDNVAGIQAQLDYLSFKCGLGSKRYRFDNGTLVTATQYVGDRQDLIQNVNKQYIAVEQLLTDTVRAILWAGKSILGAPVDPDTEITVQFDDSVIVDKETERLRDKEDVRDGIMQPWEFRVKWYGEDEQTAKRMAGASRSDDELMGYGNADA